MDHRSDRSLIGPTWRATGRLHFEKGLPCDGRYPLEYVEAYATAAGIVGIARWKLPFYGSRESFQGSYMWKAGYDIIEAEGSNEAWAMAKVVNYVIDYRRMHKGIASAGFTAEEAQRALSARR